MRLTILFLISMATCNPLLAQENLTEHTLQMEVGTKPAKAELSQFAFLQGQWSGTGLGAKCDEMWSAPAGDCMLGTFRMVEDGKLNFTEFFMLQKDADGGIVLRLKHYTPEFDGWEEKDQFVSFPLIKVEKNTAYFGGLTYAVQSDGSMKVWVAMKQKDGNFNPDYSRCVGVKIENTCFIGILFQVCGFDSSPTT
jgi:hypothetical protein